MLLDKIKARESGIILYGLVPPKKGTESEKVTEIASRQVARLQDQPIDGLIVYDIQDEATRTSEERPFPFMETLDGVEYSRDYLADIKLPRVIYRSVGKYSEASLSRFLEDSHPADELSVFVGASSADQSVTMPMSEAYALKKRVNKDMLLGGVTIPERHLVKGDEHLRVFRKIEAGCSFFVSQGVYDVHASKDFLSDYYYYGKKHGIPLVPIIFTLTPCGSQKTLQFMKWLGINIPRWLENDLIHSDDILQQSVDYSEQSWRELKEFADEKGIPIGCNIESVAVRKVEVDASIELLNRIKAI
ncbi:methylenetetrahydrofolate reductase [Enterovibrio coralii]|uniref:Methylenetetrahydrofolate reductase n=1 Tax=Enterovibrio coralii TaxID=294935 RepID=A0A135I4V0_9GAMM|nr:methylenetetrahydrofolate reductase [Enterovibrio coralii]KXF80455.1 5,10-methylenetetrahydrofolate reductase [Enterovibrio coralii]